MTNTTEPTQKNNHLKSSMASLLLSEIFSTTLRTLPNLPSLSPFLLDHVLMGYPPPKKQGNEYFPHFQPPPFEVFTSIFALDTLRTLLGECICVLLFFSFWAFFSGQGQSRSIMVTGLPAPLPRFYPVQNQAMEKPSWIIYTQEGLRESEITAKCLLSASPRNGQPSPLTFNTARMKP